MSRRSSWSCAAACEAFILVGTIIAWNMLVYWLTYAVPWLQKVLEPPPLLTKLRENGITDPRQVDKAYMEPDGQVTVLKKEEL